MPSQQSESPQKFSYAFIAKKKPVPQTSISEPVNVSKPDSAQDKHKNPTVEKEKSSRKNRRSKSNKENVENKPASKHQPISGPSDQSQADDKKENMEDEEGEGKKKRKRKRKRKKKRKDGDESDGGAMKDSTPQKEVELHFEDEEEFPDLMASTASGSNKTGGASIPLLSYSAMLKSSSLQKVPSPDVSETVVSPQEEIKEVTEEGGKYNS
ncbi:hypothetical protein FSP39_014182 [Pinctada imbricata]|uniref:Uncharacterized protein n=1 Tax=Pinctada imbricata TaxID=66713 RepID=A0AA88Y0J0_PINIB|nr:hypothetical protein FSP39_014182 [Pinctada imbricata]